MLDQRLGLPSASSIERLKLCPGSVRQSRGMPEFRTPEEIEWAESGDRIHLWLRAPGFIDLVTEELDIAKACWEQRERLILDLYPNWEFIDEKIIKTEHRMWLRRESGAHYFSGQTDWLAYMGDHTAIIADYKTNRGEQDAPDSNMQLRTLAVLAANEKDWKVEQVYVSIIQPLAGQPEVCVYKRSELIAAFRQIGEIIAATNKDDAPLNPGHKQCRYCPARINCPALAAVVERVARTNTADLAGMPAPQFEKALDDCRAAETKIKLVKAKAKELLKIDPSFLPTYFLDGGKAVREVTDPGGLFAFLVGKGWIDRELFIGKCVGVGIGDLTNALRERNEWTEAETKENLKEAEAFIDLKPQDRSLKKRKEAANV